MDTARLAPFLLGLALGLARAVAWAMALAVGLAAFGGAPGTARAAEALATPLQVDGRADIPVWPAVTLPADPDDRHDADALAGQAGRFGRPEGVPNNLGRRDETVWLRARLVVPGP